MGHVISPEARGYIAGLIDGEGCIGINKSTSPGRSPVYLARLSVTNTNTAVLGWLKELFGGSIYQARGGSTPCYHWIAWGKLALSVLGEIRDLLRIKATQAWLALEFSAQCIRYAGARGRAGLRSAEETALREGYFQAMHWLNTGRA